MNSQWIISFFIVIVLTLTFFSVSSFSQACPMCQANVPASSYVQRTGFNLTGEYTVGTIGISDITTFSSSQMFSLSGLINGLTVAASVPYNLRSVETIIGGKRLELNSSGRGDLLFYGRYNFWKTPLSSSTLSATGGIKFPTADTGFGANSTEILVGLSGSKTVYPFLFYTELTYRFLTKFLTRDSSSTSNYRFVGGYPMLDYRLGGRYPLFSRFYLLSDLSGSFGADGVITYGAFGFQFAVRRGSLTFMFKQPVVQRLERTMEVGYIALAVGTFYIR